MLLRYLSLKAKPRVVTVPVPEMLCRYESSSPLKRSANIYYVPLLQNDSAATTSQVLMCPCGALHKFRDVLTPAPLQYVFLEQNIAVRLCKLVCFYVQLKKEHTPALVAAFSGNKVHYSEPLAPVR